MLIGPTPTLPLRYLPLGSLMVWPVPSTIKVPGWAGQTITTAEKPKMHGLKKRNRHFGVPRMALNMGTPLTAFHMLGWYTEAIRVNQCGIHYTRLQKSGTRSTRRHSLHTDGLSPEPRSKIRMEFKDASTSTTMAFSSIRTRIMYQEETNHLQKRRSRSFPSE